MYSLTVHCQRLCHQYFSTRWRREMTVLLPHPLLSLLQHYSWLHCILLLPSTSLEESACLTPKWWISHLTCLEYQLKMIHLERRQPRFDSERQTVIPDSYYWCLRLLKVPSNIGGALRISWCGVTFSQDWNGKEPPPKKSNKTWRINHASSWVFPQCN